MKTHLILISAILISLQTLRAEDKIVQKLSEAREKITFLPLSSEDKFAIIRHAKILFSKIYVNLEHKKNLYQADPLSRLNDLEKNRDQLNEVQFHRSMLEIFNSVKDFHVNYNLPRPYACTSAILPVSFAKITGNKIIVSSVDLSIKDSFPQVSDITIGDELITYDHLPVLSAIESRGPNVAASTPDARIQQGVYDLFWRGLWATLAPERDNVEVALKRSNGEIYALSLPWYASSSESCLKGDNEAPDFRKGEQNGDTFLEKISERSRHIDKIKARYYAHFRPYQWEGTEKVKLSNLNPTKHKDLSWKVLNYKNHKFGYLRLKSFSAEDGIDAAVKEVEGALKQMSETQALVIDLRGNYGGQISFAEKMMALLSANPPHPLPFYIRANELTLALYNPSPIWRDLISPSVEKNIVVGPSALTPQNDLLNVSQVYFGKVVLLTNSECFSSCDIFAATMKDNAKVTIYGTDKSTFGGGANVWSSNDLSAIFKVLDVPAELPQQITMRMTGRHARRLSDHTLIEDKGVASDIVLSETTEDIINPESSAIVARILNDLIKSKNLKRSGDTELSIKEDVFIVHAKEDLLIHAVVKDIDSVTIFDHNKFLGRFKNDETGALLIRLPLNDQDYGARTLTLYAFNAKSRGVPVLRKKIDIESLASIKKLADIDLINDALFTNSPMNLKCGWKKMDRSLVMPGPYCNVSVMDANLSVELPDMSKTLTFDLTLDTEADFDFFEVKVLCEGKIETLYAPVSGQGQDHIEIDMSKFSGKKIDLKFRLISDEVGSGKGIEISNLQFK